MTQNSQCHCSPGFAGCAKHQNYYSVVAVVEVDVEVNEGLAIVSDHRPLKARMRLDFNYELKRKRRKKKQTSTFYGWKCTCQSTYEQLARAAYGVHGGGDVKYLETCLQASADLHWDWKTGSALHGTANDNDELTDLRRKRREAAAGGRRDEV